MNQFAYSIDELRQKAKEIRRDIIRMLGLAGSGHPGGSLSVSDILTVLYFHQLRHDPKIQNGPSGIAWY